MTIDDVVGRWAKSTWQWVEENGSFVCLERRDVPHPGDTFRLRFSLTGHYLALAAEAFSRLAEDFPFLLSRAQELEREVQSLRKEAEEQALIIADLKEERGDIFVLYARDGARTDLVEITNSLAEAIAVAQGYLGLALFIVNWRTHTKVWDRLPEGP